jgi:hypothetical protein
VASKGRTVIVVVKITLKAPKNGETYDIPNEEFPPKAFSSE